MITAKKATFETIPVGTKVTWHYRSAIGHGTVKGVHEKGTKLSRMMIVLRNPAIVVHSGKALARRE